MSKYKFFSLLFILLAWLTSGSAMAADWSASFNGKAGGSYEVRASAVDASGNIYLAGDSNTNIGFGSIDVNRIGSRDAFVVKLSATGTVQWLKNVGGSGASTYGNSVAVDSTGNVYLGGYFSGASLTSTPGLSLLGNQDAFVFKLDSDGNTLWAKNFGGSGALADGNSIAVDGNYVYLGGTLFGGNLADSDSPPTTLLTIVGAFDAFAIKLHSSGTTVWAKSYGGANGDAKGNSIAVDSNGSVYLGGNIRAGNLKDLATDTPLFTRIGSQTAFAIQLDADGATQWAKRIGGTGAQTSVSGRSIAVGVDGNVYLGGDFNDGNITDVSPSLTTTGEQYAFAIKLSSIGATQWAKKFGDADASVNGKSIAVDSTNNVYLGGYFTDGSLSALTLDLIGDRDAFAIQLDADGATQWAKNFGGSGAETSGSSIAVDINNNAYLVGYFENASLETPPLTQIGDTDAFAIKLDSADGSPTLSLNPSGLAAGRDVTVKSSTVDSAGNVYIAGHFNSATFTLGSTTLTRIGYQDGFAAKLDASGTVLWAKSFGGSGGSGSASVYSIAVDSAGKVYLGGFFNTAALTTNLTSPPTLTLLGGQDAFAIKLDSSGTTLWAKNFGGTGGADASGYSIAVDSTGNVYLGGTFANAHLTTPELEKIGGRDAFAIKLNSDGDFTPASGGWAKNFGGFGAYATGDSIAVDGSGNVYLGGVFNIANLTNVPLEPKIGTQDAFAIKLDSSGTPTWAKNYGGIGATVPRSSITVDGSGNVYLGGHFYGAGLTTPTLGIMGYTDTFAIKLDSSGNTTWSKSFGGDDGNGSLASTFGNSIAVDGAGYVYLGGYFESAHLTTLALTLIGNKDAFAIKLDSSGTPTWSQNYGGSGANAEGQSIAVDSTGNVYLGGYFQQASLTTPALPLIARQHGFLLKSMTAIGACGSAHATTPLVTSAPSTNLCTTGTASSVTPSNSAYTWSCTGITTDSCSASRGYTVTPSAGSNGSISPSTAVVVAHNATTAFTAAPATGYAVNNWGGSCGGTASGTGNVNYSTNAVTGNCTVSASFSPTTSYTAPSPSGGGNITMQLSGGGQACAIQSASYQSESAVGATPPAGVTFSHGVVNFTTTNTCTVGGAVSITLTYPSALPAGSQLWKYGPATAGASPSWYVHPATISQDRLSITYSVTDDGQGDSNATDGQITDPAGPGVLATTNAQSIPTLSEWGMIILAALLALGAMGVMRKGYRRS